LAGAQLALGISKPSYQSIEHVIVDEITRDKIDDKGNSYYLAHKNLTLKRAVTPAFWIATLVLLGVYVLIAFEFMHRTLAAFVGAAIILFVSYTAGVLNPDYVIITFEDAAAAIDLNVIFLLMAMMIMVSIIEKTGVFQWIASRSYQLSKGNVFVLATLLMFITAVISSFLDNVTTMLLIIPVTIKIARALKINPVALLLPEVFASNIGGTATLIGDPPNIMIGSYAELTFVDFASHLALVCLICLAVSAVYFMYWYKKDFLNSSAGDAEKMMNHFKSDDYKIKDKTLLVYCGIALGMTILLFIAHGALKMPPSIAAMTGAAVLLVVSRIDVVETIGHEIEWPTLIFFMMLFIVVAGAEETGLIQIIADWVNRISEGSLVVAVLVILWVSALASSIIDNIPFAATMLPIVAYLTQTIPGAQGGILWWALALGACLGGNGTMIGASANVVTVGMAEREGYSISFMEYLKIAFVPMIITIVLSSIWLLAIKM
jgi:Na+/H+ antiporter NhaD/arsenite permease-like protein